MNVSISPLTQELRDQLDAHGFEWKDASSHEEIPSCDHISHMERTKIMDGDQEILSCIWGYFETSGHKSEWSAGWPNSIEVLGMDVVYDVVAATIEEIIDYLKGELCK